MVENEIRESLRENIAISREGPDNKFRQLFRQRTVITRYKIYKHHIIK
jgi:hypothetical protein